MRRFWIFLSIFLLLGCSTAPKKIILISDKPEEENWYRFWYEIEIRTIHKGVEIYSPWMSVEVGKISKGIRFDEIKGFDYTNPTKKIWGVRFVRRFKELFVWRVAPKVGKQS